MKKISDTFPLYMLGGVLGLILAVCFAGRLAWAGDMEQTAIYGSGEGAPWFVTLLIICAPGAAAVLMTIASVVIVKRINRADGRKPVGVLHSVLWTLGFGAAWGPLSQWSLQTLISSLTGIAPDYKLIVISPFITGVASIVGYDMLRWWTKTRYPGLYGLLSVKHYAKSGHVGGNGDDGDLTYYQAQSAHDDDTTPTPRN
jgi:hypothetical protein